MAYRTTPSLAGWQALVASEMRLTDARLYAVPQISPNAVAWYKRPIADRKAIVAMILRGSDIDDGASAPSATEIAAVAAVVSAVLKWASNRGSPRFVLAGFDAGASLAKAVASMVSVPKSATLTVVAFGKERGGAVPEHVNLLEVVAPPAGDRRRRADGYLAEIRSLYEAGDLADMLGRDDSHTIIKLSEQPGL